MSIAVIILAFLISAAVATTSGLAVAFMCAYIPCEIGFSTTPGIPIAFWPHIAVPHAAIYGLLLGSLLSGRKWPRIRPGLIDLVVLCVLLSMAASAGAQKDLHAFFNVFDNQLMDLFLPYLLARLSFSDERARSAGLRVLIICIFILSFFGFIETRLNPYLVSHFLKDMGLWVGLNSMVYHRFGFMRAMLAFGHPIDLGNVALMWIGIVPILALTSEIGMRKWYVQLAWVCTFFLLVIAISFTAYFGLLALTGMYLGLKYIRPLRYHLALIAMIGIAGVAIYTSVVLSKKLPDRPPSNDIFAGSLWIRQVIVHRGWAMAKTAGWFGYGQSLDLKVLGLDSVDNSYILMILNYGWLTLSLFLLIPIVLGIRTSRALRRAGNEMEAHPLIIAAATMTGIMISMYTVYFGFVYANIFMLLVAFSATLAEFFLVPRAALAAEPGWEGPAEVGISGVA